MHRHARRGLAALQMAELQLTAGCQRGAAVQNGLPASSLKSDAVAPLGTMNDLCLPLFFGKSTLWKPGWTRSSRLRGS
jgi:hypothetical protein